jgi:RNA polymerase sigma-70 factor, ECF subfamily
VECDVAREALSARLDGERLHVPAARVDAHVKSCPACRRWLADATELTQRTRQAQVNGGPDLSGLVVAAADATPPPTQTGRYPFGVSRLVRYALAVAGGAQLLVAAAQIFGADFGMLAIHEHGAMTGAHLLNESTAWSLALGFGMVSAAIWPRVASGVAVVLAIFVAVLIGYVLADGWTGQVTAARIASHAPAVVGLVLILPLCLDRVGRRRRARQRRVEKQDIALPAGASWGRRRGHVRPVDHSAA